MERIVPDAITCADSARHALIAVPENQHVWDNALARFRRALLRSFVATCTTVQAVCRA